MKALRMADEGSEDGPDEGSEDGWLLGPDEGAEDGPDEGPQRMDGR